MGRHFSLQGKPEGSLTVSLLGLKSSWSIRHSPSPAGALGRSDPVQTPEHPRGLLPTPRSLGSSKPSKPAEEQGALDGCSKDPTAGSWAYLCLPGHTVTPGPGMVAPCPSCHWDPDQAQMGTAHGVNGVWDPATCEAPGAGLLFVPATERSMKAD